MLRCWLERTRHTAARQHARNAQEAAVRQDFDALELFCFYYLGLNPEGTYRFSNAHHMAKHYNCSVAEIMAALKAADLHPDTVVNTDFPMANYQVELQLASQEGDPRKLLAMASRIYDEFRAHGGKRRDWIAEIQAEQRRSQGD